MKHLNVFICSLMVALIAFPFQTLAALDSKALASSVDYVKSQSIMKGDADDFRANDTLNRAEMATILVRMLGLDTAEERMGFENYILPDVSPSAWYAPYVAVARKHGLIQGYPRTNVPADHWLFHPEMKVNRAEAVHMLWKTRAVFMSEKTHSFADVSRSPWYADAVTTLANVDGALDFIEGTSFDAEASVTRGQVAYMVHHLMKADYLSMEQSLPVNEKPEVDPVDVQPKPTTETKEEVEKEEKPAEKMKEESAKETEEKKELPEVKLPVSAAPVVTVSNFNEVEVARLSFAGGIDSVKVTDIMFENDVDGNASVLLPEEAAAVGRVRYAKIYTTAGQEIAKGAFVISDTMAVVKFDGIDNDLFAVDRRGESTFIVKIAINPIDSFSETGNRFRLRLIPGSVEAVSLNTGKESGQITPSLTEEEYRGPLFVMRNTQPIVKAMEVTEGVGLNVTDGAISRFTVRVPEGTSLSLARLAARIDTSNVAVAGLKLYSDFGDGSINRGRSLIEATTDYDAQGNVVKAIGQNNVFGTLGSVASNTNSAYTAMLDFTDEFYIKGGKTYQFELVGHIRDSAATANVTSRSVSVKLLTDSIHPGDIAGLEDPEKVSVLKGEGGTVIDSPDVAGTDNTGFLFIWSDHSSPAHSFESNPDGSAKGAYSNGFEIVGLPTSSMSVEVK